MLTNVIISTHFILGIADTIHFAGTYFAKSILHVYI